MGRLLADFNSEHLGAVHDCQLDYYGKKLATTSSDHTIKLWDISATQNVFSKNLYNNYTNDNMNNNNNVASPLPVFLAELKGHEGPVWQVSWAHPKFGGIIASCSFDRRVIIWREARQNEWQIVYKCEDHKASVNSLGWCPWEYGLQLACGSSDGYISVLSYKPEINSWVRKTFLAHSNGVNAVSWAPFSESSMREGENTYANGIKDVAKDGGKAVGNESSENGNFVAAGVVGGSSGQKIVSGGCDNQVRIWKLDETSNEWIEIHRLDDRNGAHTDWVRDVAWRPNIGLSSNYIASCSEDETVIIWYQENDNMPWKNIQTIKMGAPVWRITWSVTGNVLAVANGDNAVTLFKETVGGKFERVTSLGDNSNNINVGNMNLPQYNYSNGAPNYEYNNNNNNNNNNSNSNNFAQLQSRTPVVSSNPNNVVAVQGGGGGGGGDGTDLKGIITAHNSSTGGIQQSNVPISSTTIMDIGDQSVVKTPFGGIAAGGGRGIIGDVGVLNFSDSSQNPFSAYSPNVPTNMSINGLNQNMMLHNFQNSYSHQMNMQQVSPVGGYEAINAQQGVPIMPPTANVRGGLPSVGAGGPQQSQNSSILRR